jgi:phosphohistidine phosphatase
MTLYFLRHGKADWPDWDRPDAERPLTEKGKKETRKVAKFLAKAKVAPKLILSSPLPRALQTAEIAARKLDAPLVEDPALAKKFDKEKLESLLKKYPGDAVMLVGHEPSFSEVVGAITNGAVKMAKSAVACVNVSLTSMSGELLWLVTPKLLKK